MAPEQSEGREVGEEADLYALALVLYEALSGVNPVRGATPAATARRIGRRLEPLERRRRDLPRALTRAIDTRPRTLAAQTAGRSRSSAARSSRPASGLLARAAGAIAPRSSSRHLPRPRSTPPLRRALAPARGAQVLAAGATARRDRARRGGAGEKTSARPAPAACALPRTLSGSHARSRRSAGRRGSGRPGVALLAAAALAPLLALPRRVGPAWMTCALAPAARARRARGRLSRGRRAGPPLAPAGGARSARLLVADTRRAAARTAAVARSRRRERPPASVWEGSLGSSAAHVVGPLLTPGVLLGALLWAVAARRAALDRSRSQRCDGHRRGHRLVGRGRLGCPAARWRVSLPTPPIRARAARSSGASSAACSRSQPAPCGDPSDRRVRSMARRFPADLRRSCHAVSR